MKKKKMSFTTVGGSPILTIFAVLCFIVFALLSLSTARADSILAGKSLDAVTKYYEADTQAEEILARIRTGECPEGVVRKGKQYQYSCPVDEHQQLSIVVDVDGDSYQIRKWRKEYVSDWQADDSIRVWGGTEEIVE